MYDWIEQLTPGQRVLDLASGPGSFPASHFPCCVVALDEDVDAFRTAGATGFRRVFGKSASLPFASAVFDLVICHHALEHIAEVEETLAEVARILKPGGRLYVAVPDGHSLCDGIYRLLFEGGGHVNRFRRAELVAMVERAVGARLVRWQKLYSSFVYLRRLQALLAAPPPDLARRLRRMKRAPLGAAQWSVYIASRVLDRCFGAGLGVYGWALYFERAAAPPAVVEDPAYINVCLYCGAGTEAAGVRRKFGVAYICGSCSRVNPYFPPFDHTV